MVNPEILVLYFGGVLQFTRKIEVSLQDGTGNNKTYDNKQYVRITPAILYLISSQLVPVDSYKIVLRQLKQVEDSELIELSKIIVPANRYPHHIRKVCRQGKGRAYTVEIILASDAVMEHTIVINRQFDVALSEVYKFPNGGKPVVQHKAVQNQSEIFKWFLAKHLDVFGLLQKQKAFARSKWGLSDYQKP